MYYSSRYPNLNIPNYGSDFRAVVTIAAGSVEEVAVAGGVDVMVAVGAVVEHLEDLVAAEFFNPHQDLASAADCGRAGVAW
ncbi:hypothetical protein RHSIM_Rhsim05G0016400 [Rhododendron simsii]|uniref:Uncharacterized protein n=1 Tax=Rhododendron simsii TaxID=118357 RepID=A0A834LN64_RHOSS|nr:hypothetical protein RHSIM_Rhsim05G0016400 [Rhododendron simsii]